MILTLTLLVSEDAQGQVMARLPFTSRPPWRGRSLARLLDDVALDLMEKVPKMEPEEVAALAFCPRTELRRINVEIEVPPSPPKREPTIFEGRVACVIAQWAHENFWLATLPHQGPSAFAVHHPGALSAALHRHLQDGTIQRGLGWLQRAAPDTRDGLELLEVPVDLPTPLPSSGLPTVRRKRKRKTEENTEKEAAPGKEQRKLVPPRHLSEVGESWTHKASDGRLPHASRRDALVQEVLDQLQRPGAAVLLVGPHGVGKTAIVQEVAHRLTALGTGPIDRRDLWYADANRIIAGMSFVGAWEQRVAGLVDELAARKDILYVADLPGLVFTGRSAHGDTNVAQYLDPHLARGEIRILGECTSERLEAVRDENPGFFQKFRIVGVEAMTERDALLVLASEVRRVSEDRYINVGPEALETVLSLTRRFESHLALPGRAAALLRRILSERRRETKDELGRPAITRDGIIDHYGERTGLPEFVLKTDLAHPPQDIEKYFANRIVGQPEAVRSAVDLVVRIEQGLADPDRPFGTYLFVGPTGVGKTETAKALAELLFGDPSRLVRLDMSEFQAPWSTVRLFGGYGRPDGELTAQVARQPFSVVLLDEIEKAHPSVFDALLQVLGEGRLTNAAGHTVSFRSTIVIMTSNLGVRSADRTLGFNEEKPEDAACRYTSAAEGFFRPELFNRIDEVVAFRRLTEEVILPLTRRLLSSLLQRRGLAQTETLVEVDPSLPEQLVSRGFDPRYGARSMRRILEAELAVPLAEHLVRAPPGGLSVVHLSPVADGVAVDVHRPIRPEVRTHPSSAPPRSWQEFDERFEKLFADLDRISTGPDCMEVKRRRRDLIERLNRSEATAEERDRILALSAPLDEIAELAEDAEAYVAAPEPYLESIERLVSYTSEGPRVREADAARPIPVVRGPFDSSRGDTLVSLELRVSGIEVGLHFALQPPASPVVLRIEPVGDDEGSLDFARACAELLNCILEPGRSVGLWGYGKNGWVERFEPLDQVRALSVLSPDALQRVQSELGIWVSRTRTGLHRGTVAARVVDIGDGRSTDEILEEDNRDPTKTRKLEPASSTIARWFDDGTAIDPSTGVELKMGGNGFYRAWILRAASRLS